MATKRDKGLLASLDWFTIALFLVMMVLGWFCICGASYEYMDVNFFSLEQRTGKQALWMLLSLVLAGGLLCFKRDFYETYAYIFYILLIVLDVATIFLARDHKGSHSWLDLGSVSVQPAEFTKFATTLALARLLNTYQFSLRRKRDFLLCLAVIMLPVGIIVGQDETGSALVYLSLFLMLYREGMTGNILLVGLCAVLFFVVGVRYGEVQMESMPVSVGIFSVLLMVQLIGTAVIPFWCREVRPFWVMLAINGGGTLCVWLFSLFFVPFDVVYAQWVLLGVGAAYMLFRFLKQRVWGNLFVSLFIALSVAFLYSTDYFFEHSLKDYQRNRIKVSLGMMEDLDRVGYNVNQSLIAIGSGGLCGKGFLNGTQTKLKYVPEQDTDFIFCTIGEEQGFVGSVGVILLFVVLILRIVYIAERQTDAFGRVFGYSVASILIFHLIINIGMVLGITPVIGIPLPFFSYGGSSLWGFTILLFILLRIDAERNAQS